jgi:hypothetical protein
MQAASYKDVAPTALEIPTGANQPLAKSFASESGLVEQVH